MTASNELLWLLVAVISIWLYTPLNHRLPQLYLASRFDKETPLLPLFVIPYLALFPYALFAFAILYVTPFAIAFYATVTIAMVAAALFWYFLPTGVHRPRHMQRGLFTSLLKFVYGHDGDANAFPSGHVFGAVIISFYLSQTFPAFAVLWWVCGCAIGLSTIFIKQHNILDIIGGIVWAIAALLIVHFLGSLL